MKKRKLKREVQDVLGVIILYLTIILGVIIVNARFEYLNQVIK